VSPPAKTDKAQAEPDTPISRRRNGGWKERALERSLEPARNRALDRTRRLIAVTTTLIAEKGLEFTVQDVVTASKSSLRAFYQHFESKDDLLLAVFEEAIHSAASDLHKLTDSIDGPPLDHLRAFVTGLYDLVERTPTSRTLVLYHLSLAETRPDEFRYALNPLLAEITTLVEAASAEQSVRADMEPTILAALVMQTVVTAIHMSLLGASLSDVPASGEDMWSFCCTGIGASVTDTSR
jgi:AcrR family transcriptional regulator